MKTIKLYLLLLAMLTALPISLQAQLKKTANVEKVKSFTNGSVTLFKTTTASGGVVYSVTLRNNSKYFDDIVLFLGNKEDMIKNLNDFSIALKEGKKGDHFDFSANGSDYYLAFDKVLGQKCFRVSEPYSITDNYGRFFKATIDSIIEYFGKMQSQESADKEDFN